MYFYQVKITLEESDYYYEGSNMVFTEQYHLKRGYCCGNGCRHCAYKQNKMYKSIFNWSGGKDSSLALYHILKDKSYSIDKLLTTINSSYNRVSMHGVRTELLEEQAKQLNLPLHKIELPEQPNIIDYEEVMLTTMKTIKEEGFTHSAFGDIFLEDLKKYRENKLQSQGFSAVFPLWKRDTKELLNEFLDLGFKTILVCIKADLLDKSFAGRIIDKDFINDLPDNVDPCGENGEFHTFVFDGPIFNKPIEFEIGETIYREYEAPKDSNDSCTLSESKNMGFYFTDLIAK